MKELFARQIVTQSSLATICGLLTRSWGMSPPPLHPIFPILIFLENLSLRVSKWPTEKLKLLCLPVCLLPLLTKLNPAKKQTESVIL
jgi:hypothetical protein